MTEIIDLYAMNPSICLFFVYFDGYITFSFKQLHTYKLKISLVILFTLEHMISY